MIADAFDNCMRAAVANGKPFARQAAHVCFSARRAVERHIPDDDVVFRNETRARRRTDRQLAAGKTLAPIIIRVAFKGHRDAARQECAKALAGGTLEVNLDGSVRQSIGAVA